MSAGNEASITYSPVGNQLIGVDSVHFVIQFDTASLSLSELNISGNWKLLDSSRNGNMLDLWLTLDSMYEIDWPHLELRFKTYLASSSAKIYLDSANFYGGCQTCACSLSANGPDSVEIDFTGCGDSTILAAMEDHAPFSIESIVPNPAFASLRVEGSGQSVKAELFDALGKETLPPTLYALPFTLNVSLLPSGTYFLRLSQDGYVQ
ncbi:MAG TPA: T9SS type A sorting domain-containing protein, partial [Candidatus Kapabacteria bacterium]|nr:T9SS type A sorting domain-containing protein [Candidatus Kapabacteria bacterium]